MDFQIIGSLVSCILNNIKYIFSVLNAIKSILKMYTHTCIRINVIIIPRKILCSVKK